MIHREPTNFISSSHRKISREGEENAKLKRSENKLSTVKVTDSTNVTVSNQDYGLSGENRTSNH